MTFMFVWVEKSRPNFVNRNRVARSPNGTIASLVKFITLAFNLETFFPFAIHCNIRFCPFSKVKLFGSLSLSLIVHLSVFCLYHLMSLSRKFQFVFWYGRRCCCCIFCCYCYSNTCFVVATHNTLYFPFSVSKSPHIFCRSHVIRDICLTATLCRWHQSNFLNDHLEQSRGQTGQNQRRSAMSGFN